MEGELRWAAALLIQSFGLTGDLTDQVIEGRPGEAFTGRLSIVVKEQPTNQNPVVTFTPAVSA